MKFLSDLLLHIPTRWDMYKCILLPILPSVMTMGGTKTWWYLTGKNNLSFFNAACDAFLGGLYPYKTNKQSLTFEDKMTQNIKYPVFMALRLNRMNSIWLVFNYNWILITSTVLNWSSFGKITIIVII